jgi:hypothetical protein
VLLRVESSTSRLNSGDATPINSLHQELTE